MIYSATEFVSLRTSERQADYLRAATDNAPIEVWQEVIEQFPSMRIWVAHNKTVPIEILEVLARDPDPEVRVTVAMKNKLSRSLMGLLSEDTNDKVRERIAYNKRTPTDILEYLARDPCERVSSVSRSRLHVQRLGHSR